MLVVLEELTRQMDWSEEGDETMTVAAIRSVPYVLWSTCVDMTRTQDGVDPTRNVSQDLGQLVAGGQGHCHGLTSAMAAFLLVLGPFVGLSVTYRAGYTFRVGQDDVVSNTIDRHHWCEYTVFPTMESFVCDVSLYGARGQAESRARGAYGGVDGDRLDRGGVVAAVQSSLSCVRRSASVASSFELSLPIDVAYSLGGGRYVSNSLPVPLLP